MWVVPRSAGPAGLASAIALGLAGLAGLACAGCDSGTGSSDAGSDAGTDAGPRGPLSVAIEGPSFAYVGEEACFTAAHAEGAGAATRWNWGDGEADDQPSSACHTWAFPGPVVLGVTLRARGMRADATRSVAVVFAPEDPRPTHSSPIVYDAVRQRVWAVNPDSDSVALLEADPPALIREIPVGDHPRTLALLGDRVAVACQGSGALVLLDAESGAPAGALPLGEGSEPYGVLADPRGRHLYLSLMGAGEVVSVDAEGPGGPAERSRVAVGPDPRGLAMSARGALLVTRWRATQAGAEVYNVDATDPGALRAAAPTALPRQEELDSDTDNSGVLGFVTQIVPSPDGARALMPALKANVVTGAFRTGLPLSSQTTARAVLAEVTFGAPGTPAADSYRHSFDDLDYASALVFSPLGDRVYVAMQGAQVVIAADAFSFFSAGSIDDVGEAPQGLALSPDGRRLYVQAFLSRSVRVYEVSDLSREPPLLAEVRTVGEEPLEPQVLLGKQIFYRSRDPRMSRTRYLSCASCHMDGQGDGLVWDFTQRGEGLRNTISLLGHAGTALGPLHWSANFDEVQDFEHDIRGGQGGAGFLPDALFHSGSVDTPLGDPKAGLSEELDALAAYLGSLASFGRSPWRREGEPGWEAAFARGRAVFLDPAVGCAGCHAGPAFTDSAFLPDGSPLLHDVGTLGAGSGGRLGGPLPGLDTPTLLGLFRTAPYLHDGSAATLREVLVDRNPEDRHGTTSFLTDSQITDLVLYLLSLDDRDAAP